MRRADGRYGGVHHAAVPAADAGGRFAGYLGTCQDITERRGAELSARDRERMMRVLADNLPALPPLQAEVQLLRLGKT